MALSVTVGDRIKYGNRYGVFADVTFDDSYPTGGEAFDANELLGLSEVDLVMVEGGSGYDVEYDYTNKKLKAYASAGTEVTAATNLSAVSVKVLAIGI